MEWQVSKNNPSLLWHREGDTVYFKDIETNREWNRPHIEKIKQPIPPTPYQKETTFYNVTVQCPKCGIFSKGKLDAI